MDENALIMEAIAGVVFAVVGGRLFLASRKAGQAPEFFIALTFLIWALGYALYDIPAIFANDDSVPPLFAYTSLVAFSLGNVAIAMFTKMTFRNQSRWAGRFVGAIAFCLAWGLAGSAWVGDWEQVDPFANPGYWPQVVGGLAPSAWMGVEGLRHFAMSRRRRKVGLCDAWTCHQFLLWGLAGLLWTALEIVVVVQDFVYLSAGDWSSALGVANGLLELLPIGMIWLAFFAPRGYRRWIDAAAAA